MVDAKQNTTVTDDEVVLVLDNGNRIVSGGLEFQAGADVRVLAPDGEEIGYWDCAEWRDDPEPSKELFAS